MAVALFAACNICLYLIFSFLVQWPPERCRGFLIAVLLVGGGPLVFGLVRRALAGEFGSDLLAGISIIAATILGEYLAGAIIVLMLSGGSTLELYATHRASAVLEALAGRMPRIAHRKNGEQTVDVDVSEIRLGEHLVLFPHETCPVDGVVVEGRGSMNESYLTGEPFLMGKAPGAAVLSGALNSNSVLTISVSRLPADSRYAKIMRVMQEAEANRPKIRRIADRLGAWYTLLALSMGVAGWLIGGSAQRFLAVVVIATPCPLLLAIPVAIVGAVSLAASRSIIVKNPSMLERIDGCRTVIFDKTGTLTYGKPTLTEVVCAPGYERRHIIQIAASLEQYSRHPLASTITEAAKREGIPLALVEEVAEQPGQGLTGRVAGKLIWITGRAQAAASGTEFAGSPPASSSGMECVILIDGKYAGTLRFRDTPRRDSRSFVTHLNPRHQVKKILLLSGDREPEVRHLAGEVGITETLSSQTPEQKLAVVRAETKLADTLFIGDGINDAPAMQAATVGVAFGPGSDVTAEAADAVILEPTLEKVDELIHIGRRMKRIALQSAVGGMSLSMLGMLIAAAGYLPPVEGAIAQEVIDVAAVVNALRVVLSKPQLQDYQTARQDSK